MLVRSGPLLLVSKWCGCLAKAYQEMPSGANHDDILQNTHDSYEIKVEKGSTRCIGGIYLGINLNGRVHVIKLSKRLRINELGVHSDTSSPGTPRTPFTPSTPVNVDSDDTATTEVGWII